MSNFVRLLFVFLIALTNDLAAAEWSNTELHYQRGNLDVPNFAGGGDVATDVLTFQHASGWKYGENFFFIDFLNDSKTDGFNDSDYYGELYVNFSLGKLFNRSTEFGLINGLGIIAGLNIAGDGNVRKYLPGIRLSWKLPGFAFLNTDITAYLDDSGGVKSGGAPAEDDSYMIDVNWAFPLTIRGHRFSIEGHVEYIGQRDNEFGAEVSEWLLAQPQFRYDLGKTLFDTPDQLYVGVEWQLWLNKLGEKGTDESVIQALVVWRL